MTAVEPRENAQASAQAGAQAARQLRARISNGQLPPGAKLSEQAVARELGVSRNTLREAFTMLAAERLVDRIAHSPTPTTSATSTPPAASWSRAPCCGVRPIRSRCPG